MRVATRVNQLFRGYKRVGHFVGAGLLLHISRAVANREGGGSPKCTPSLSPTEWQFILLFFFHHSSSVLLVVHFALRDASFHELIATSIFLTFFRKWNSAYVLTLWGGSGLDAKESKWTNLTAAKIAEMSPPTHGEIYPTAVHTKGGRSSNKSGTLAFHELEEDLLHAAVLLKILPLV